MSFLEKQIKLENFIPDVRGWGAFSVRFVPFGLRSPYCLCWLKDYYIRSAFLQLRSGRFEGDAMTHMLRMVATYILRNGEFYDKDDNIISLNEFLEFCE